MSDTQKAELSPYEAMDVAVLAGDVAAFTEAFTTSIYGLSMDDRGVYTRQLFEEGYILEGEQELGAYSFPEALLRAVKGRKESFATRDRLWLDRQKSSDDMGLVGLGDNPISTEARIEKDMLCFALEVAFRLGVSVELVPVEIERFVRGEPNYERREYSED